MNKIIKISIVAIVVILMTSCNSMEKDAKKLAKLQYEYAQNMLDFSKAAEALAFEKECKKKYEGKEIEFTALLLKEYSKWE
jgi:hypothetical protein